MIFSIRSTHGLYIGPYYSFNKFKRDNLWEYKNSAYDNDVTTSSNLTIHTLGIQLGYQFLLWKRVTLDMVMVGPGLGIYEYQSKFEGNLNTEQKEQIKEGLQQLITQKFPGMNFVFSDKQIDGKGVMKANTLGYRFIVHVGFNF